MKELETYYDSCREAPVPDLHVPARKSIGRMMLMPAAGLACGFALALALVMATPKPNVEDGRDAAEAISQMQLAETTPKPAGKPRAVHSVNWNA